MKIKISLFLIFLFSFLFVFTALAKSSNVLIVEMTDTIDQSSVEILDEAITRADQDGSEAIILILDTPGGGLTQTFEIADMINKSSIPVVGYVYPTGSASWSAGTFILMSTHIAAMADFTLIGSCQPVEITAEGTKYITENKTINALVAWIENKAEMYNRNKSVVERFVTENLNLNSTNAFNYGVIEFVSDSIEELLVKIDGSVVKTSEGEVVLDTENAKKNYFSPSIGVQIMKFFSNPIISSLLLILGIFSLIFGISTPGFGAEIFGVIAILLSIVGSGFAISLLSIIFIIMGVLLIIIELFATPGFGIIGIGGIICMSIGSIFLIPNYSSARWVVSMEWINDAILVIAVTAVIIAIFFVFLIYKVVLIWKKKAATGTFIGEKAKTIDRISPGNPGYVLFKGEYWQAESDLIIEPKTKVTIVAKEESTLKIKPLK